MAAFQGRQTEEIAQDEGRRLDSGDLNMSVVTQTWPSTCYLKKRAVLMAWTVHAYKRLNK